jgi:ribosome-associated toxin RatA of RatAB toxin-antitoxin module
MKQVNRSMLLWYSPREMYTLVTAIETYPQFLPWCERAEVLERDRAGVTARLHMAYGGVRHAFTTRNRHVEDREVVVALVDGPFTALDGTWRFVPLALPGSEAGNAACRIDFDLRYGFKRGALDPVVGPVFDRIADTLVESFVKRAERVYGRR